MKLTNETKYLIKHYRTDSLLKKLKYQEYAFYNYGEVFSNTPSLLKKVESVRINEYEFKNMSMKGNALLKASNQFNKNEYKRKKRLKARVKQMLEKKCLFLTLTFNQENYSNTNQDTRRRYAYYMLKSLGTPFLCNQDWGKLNGRHHIHALIQSERIDNSNSKLWKYGALNIEKCRSSKCGEYVGKLTEHAFKNTTFNTRIMYSRNYNWVKVY